MINDEDARWWRDWRRRAKEGGSTDGDKARGKERRGGKMTRENKEEEVIKRKREEEIVRCKEEEQQNKEGTNN
jgi:hypothetical protein